MSESNNQPCDPPLETGSGGANQQRARAYNERLVMSLIRRQGSMPKSEIARRTGLSAQAVSVIMGSLEKDGLLLRGEPVRGKVGQPSIPMSLNPDGAFSIGLKIGRRSADLVLLDFTGNTRFRLQQSYPYPTPASLLQFITDGIEEFETKLTAKQRQRIAGTGVSFPYDLWDWADNFAAPATEMRAWKNLDLEAELMAIRDYPVFLQNDATAACGAELVFGHGQDLTDFVYFFIGTFIGGGIVLNQSVFRGNSGNAGAIGSMPVIAADGSISQLIDHASLLTLEMKLQAQDNNFTSLWTTDNDWNACNPVLEEWIDETGKHLSIAIANSCSVIDFSAVVIDGAFPPEIRQRLVNRTRDLLIELNLPGLVIPDVYEGQIGDGARAIGGACLPLFSRYLLDQNVLFSGTVLPT